MLKRIKKLVYLAGLYSVGSVFEKGIAFVFIPIYTAYLGTAEYGILGLMLVTTQLCASIFFPPVNQGFVRHYYAVEFKGKQGLLLFNCFLFLAIQGLLFAVIFFWFSKVIASTLLENEDLIIIVQIYAFILFFQPLCNFLFTFLRQIEKAKLTIIISGLHSLLYAGFVLSGLILFDLGVMAMIYGLLLGFVFKVCCILPVFWRESTHEVSFSVLIQPLKYGYQRLLVGSFDAVIQGGDRYVLLIFSSIASVGLYNFGWQIASIITFLFIVPLEAAFEPIILKQEENPAEQKEFIKKGATYFYLVGMIICLSLALYSKEFIELMATKHEFWESWVVVPVITFSCLILGLNDFFLWGLVMTKKGFRMSAIIVIGGIVNIGFNFILIPYWGIMGAAFATLISYFFMGGISIYYSAKYFNLHFELSRLVHITFAGIGLFTLAQYVANTDSLATNLSLKLLILLSFPLIIFMTGFFKRKEINQIQKLWNNVREDGFRATYEKVRALG